MNDSKVVQQVQQTEWHWQWSHHQSETEFLFFDWIAPRTLDDFNGKRVFDAGCGGGHHVRIVAPVARHVTGIDLNAASVASRRLAGFPNVQILEGDIARHQAEEAFDVVYCIGVIQHTDNPDKTFNNLKKLCKRGGLLIVWCYSLEGNELVWRIVEPLRKMFLRHMGRKTVEIISYLITVGLYFPIYTLYLLPLPRLPFYEYFQNFRRLSLYRNMLNVFDKLNAPQTEFISRARIEKWFNEKDFKEISITAYKGVSWRASGIVRDV
ncbi:MAG: class I SAM-dependent methyltransferase [Desulfobacula sp.]|nr:class I SAM-dependent methyltransferase [Desulfobacula sp.]